MPKVYKLRHWPPGTDLVVRAVFFSARGLLVSTFLVRDVRQSEQAEPVLDSRLQ